MNPVLVALGEAADQLAAFAPAGALFRGSAIPGRAPEAWGSVCLATLGPIGSADLARAFAEVRPGTGALVLASPMGAPQGAPARQGSPPRVRCLVFSNPVEGQDSEFNRWYSDDHIPDVLRTPGYLCARRYRIELEGTPPPRPAWRYLTIYEVAQAGYADAMKALAARSAAGEIPISAAADRPTSAHFAPRDRGPATP